jgi:hypothetical protein
MQLHVWRQWYPAANQENTLKDTVQISTTAHSLGQPLFTKVHSMSMNYPVETGDMLSYAFGFKLTRRTPEYAIRWSVIIDTAPCLDEDVLLIF